jgi:hypothetical protein
MRHLIKQFSFLAFCLFSLIFSGTRADAIYTVNAVGYINVDVWPGYNLLANAFAEDLVLQGSYDFSTASGEPIAGLTVYKYVRETHSFETSVYDPSSRTFSRPLRIASGEGFFVFNPAGTAVTLTQVGSISQGTITYSLGKGLHLLGAKVPRRGPISEVLQMPPIPGAQVYLVGKGGGYQIFTYDEFGEGWIPFEPWIVPGEGFWLRLPEAATWSHEFQVNQ